MILRNASCPYGLLYGLYSLSITLSAFLLFSVQPLFGKMMLPVFGGGASVWITALFFFQLALLAGYSYAHLLVRYFSVRKQLFLHLGFLILCGLVLPLAMPEGGMTDDYSEKPVISQIAIMGVALGSPFLILASCSLLLQSWFYNSEHPQANNPYFLYAASNAGSLFALLSYPVFIEPFITLSAQKILWSGGYAVLGFLVLVTALMTFRHIKTAPVTKEDFAPSFGWKEALSWLFLAFLPCSLMMGVTTYVTMDTASVPLLWIVPLALYLLTFIIAFSGWGSGGPDRKGKLNLAWVEYAQLALLMVIFFTFIENSASHGIFPLFFHLAFFFISALICHCFLARSRPKGPDLTQFYIVIALGGALGGAFNVLLAPALFPIPLEYPLIIGLICLARFWNDPAQKLSVVIKEAHVSKAFIILIALIVITLFVATSPAIWALSDTLKYTCMALLFLMFAILQKKRWAFAFIVTVSMLAYPSHGWKELSKLAYLSRNSFGVQRVYDSPTSRELVQGTTNYGIQAKIVEVLNVPLAYYHPTTPAGDAFKVLDGRKGPQKIAAIGLGIGSIACYSRPNRFFDFYEINPEIIKIAEDKDLFTFLSGCGSPYKIIEGDGRLKIAQAEDHSYDMIFLDAFNSDNIPIHLLTREAFELYFKKLKPDGLIVVHLTNRFFQLQKVMAANGKSLGVTALFKDTPDRVVKASKYSNVPVAVYNTQYALLTKDDASQYILGQYFRWGRYKNLGSFKAWTDDYSNILSVLRLSRAKAAPTP